MADLLRDLVRRLSFSESKDSSLGESSNQREDFLLRFRSSMDWARFVVKDLNRFIQDHAACERKASATCMSFVAKYSDKPDFVEAMIQVALEELEHFHQVYRLMRARGIALGADEKDDYVNMLLQSCANSPEGRFLDRILCFGIIEARGFERFSLISKALAEKNPEGQPESHPEKQIDQELVQFYARLAKEEAKHFALFLRYALQYFSEDVVVARLDQLLDLEAEIMKKLPWRHALH